MFITLVKKIVVEKMKRFSNGTRTKRSDFVNNMRNGHEGMLDELEIEHDIFASVRKNYVNKSNIDNIGQSIQSIVVQS